MRNYNIFRGQVAEFSANKLGKQTLYQVPQLACEESIGAFGIQIDTVYEGFLVGQSANFKVTALIEWGSAYGGGANVDASNGTLVTPIAPVSTKVSVFLEPLFEGGDIVIPDGAVVQCTASLQYQVNKRGRPQYTPPSKEIVNGTAIFKVPSHAYSVEVFSNTGGAITSLSVGTSIVEMYSTTSNQAPVSGAGWLTVRASPGSRVCPVFKLDL